MTGETCAVQVEFRSMCILNTGRVCMYINYKFLIYVLSAQ